MTQKLKNKIEAMKITSHVDPAFFKDEQKNLKTDELQRVFGQGANYMIDEITALLGSQEDLDDQLSEINERLKNIENDLYNLNRKGPMFI